MSDRVPTAQRKGPGRRLQVRALVAGLSPTVLPATIVAVSRTGLLLALDAATAAVDERWALADTGVLVIFGADRNGRRERVTVHGRLRKRTPGAVDIGLVAVDERTLEALRSIARSAKPAGGEPAAAARVTRQMIAAACGECADRHAGAIVAAYFDTLATGIARSRAGAAPGAETKRLANAAAELADLRPRIEPGLAQSLPTDLRACLAGGAADAGATAPPGGGLSLVESIDLRVGLAVTEAVNRVATRLAGAWAPLQQRLALLGGRSAEDCGIAPALLCHHLRDSVFHDEAAGALRFIDLTAGFADDFVSRLERLYEELNGLLDRHGVRLQVRAAPERRPGR